MTPQAQRFNEGISEESGHGYSLKDSNIFCGSLNFFLFSNEIGNLEGIQGAEGKINVFIIVILANGPDRVSQGLCPTAVGSDANQFRLVVFDVLSDDLVVGEFFQFFIVDKSDLER